MTLARLWLPLIVRVPAKTTVVVPGSSAPAVYVQLRPVRIVPARVSVPDGLSMTTLARLPAARVEAPVNVWSAAAVDEQRAGAGVERGGLADRTLRGDRAGRDVAVGQGQRPGHTEGRAGGDGVGHAAPLRTTALSVWLPVIVRVPANTTVLVPASSVPAV